MNTIVSKLAATGVIFLLVFLSGFWLSRSGRPYPVALFTVHKLIALGAVIYLATLVARLHQTTPLQTAQWAGVAVAALCILLTIITGGLASLGNAMPAFLLKVHHLLPYLTVISLGASLYLLLTRAGLFSPA